MNDDFKFFITLLLLFCNGYILQEYLNHINIEEIKYLLIMPFVITLLSLVIWLVSEDNSNYKKKVFRLFIFCLIAPSNDSH
jgi:hypothetical protein